MMQINKNHTSKIKYQFKVESQHNIVLYLHRKILSHIKIAKNTYIIWQKNKHMWTYETNIVLFICRGFGICPLFKMSPPPIFIIKWGKYPLKQYEHLYHKWLWNYLIWWPHSPIFAKYKFLDTTLEDFTLMNI